MLSTIGRWPMKLLARFLPQPEHSTSSLSWVCWWGGCWEIYLLGTNISLFKGTFEDVFPFPKVEYGLVPWRVPWQKMRLQKIPLWDANEQWSFHPALVGIFFGDEKLPSYIGIIISHCIRIPMKQRGFNGMFIRVLLPLLKCFPLLGTQFSWFSLT